MPFVPRVLYAFAALVLAQGGIPQAPAGNGSPLAVRITSPMGRTGLPGPIRIVAQVNPAPTTTHGVWIYVDQQLVASREAPPYVAEWVDENPFDRREITVVARDALGREATDKVVLEPFEVTEVSEVASVLLEASVQDAEGRFVRNLTASSFTLTEDGVTQKLDLVQQEQVGATFAMLIDSSASMSRRMDFVQRTAATLAGYLTERDQMVVAPFARGMGAITGPTRDVPTIRESIAAIRPTGGTAIMDALIEVSKSLQSAEGRRAIVLITDGYDEHSAGTFDEALRAVKAAHATVYVVGIGGVAGISIKGERLLRQIARESGGRWFFPSRDLQLTEVHDTLTEDVANRYLITYTPSNQTVDGSWRAIDVSTGVKDHVIRTRPGYFAPKPPPLRPNIEFTATDPAGNYLELTAEDIEIVEGGVAQSLETFQEAIQPVSIVLALDSSGSMRRKEADVVESGRRFVDALRKEDKLALMLFADKAETVQGLSTNRAASHEAIKGYRAAGGTALYDALADSFLLLQPEEGRKVVVVMTDGRDEDNPGTGPGSRRSLDEVMKLQKESGVTVFGIGLGTNVDTAPLQKLAAASGGQALFPALVTDLDREFKRVVEDLRRRYVVSYTATDPKRDGQWRQVEIRIRNRPDAVVRGAGGYFAPSK
jgi:Ca-activated chloride channel family protein